MRAIRTIHTVPSLVQAGIPRPFSANGFRTAWTEYQQLLMDKLNRVTVDTDNEHRLPFHILLNTASKRNEAHVFNYASQAHNNHLFFQSLLDDTAPDSAPPSPMLSRRIEQRFGGVCGLQAAFNSAVERVPSNGWVFLVQRPSKMLDVVITNNAGSPYTLQRAQSQDLTMTLSEDAAREYSKTVEAVKQNQKNFDIALLALNLWEHAWVPDFGVAGRDEYVRQWWDAVDWNVVSSRVFE